MRRTLGTQWEFATLLILLFGIATLGVWSVLSFLEENLERSVYPVVAVLICSISLGFMLIAGAFGIWAIKFASEAESRRRIGLLVDAMDYISDGLLAVNPKNRIVGSNPAARRIAESELAHQEDMASIFPCLSESDMTHLLKSHEPVELEREILSEGKSRTLRFRAQQSEGLVLLMVGDVTAINSKRLLARQSARLQLLGQLARGVAHDFNHILWTVSTHSSLMQRLPPGSAELAESSQTIMKASERGMALANHLQQLSEASIAGKSTHQAEEYVRNAELLLRDSIPYGWQVECSVTGELPPIPLSGPELEQAILNLGLLLTETHPKPGMIRIIGSRPHAANIFNVDPRFACVILITALLPGEDALAVGQDANPSRERGVILSVIRSMIEEVDGRLDELSSMSGAPAFRVVLPHAGHLPPLTVATDAMSDLNHQVENWTALLSLPATPPYLALTQSLKASGMNCKHVSEVTTTLAELDPESHLDVILIDKPILGSEATALIKAIIKLKPAAALVVLCDDPDSEPEALRADVVFIESQTEARPILKAFIAARTLALRRNSGASIGTRRPGTV